MSGVIPNSTLDRVLARSKKLDGEKYPWLALYELISEYVMLRYVSFVTDQQFYPNQFIPDRVFDSTASRANYRMASALIGALWPSGEKTFRIVPPAEMDRSIASRSDVKQWYEQATKIVQRAIGNHKAGFDNVLMEYMHDQGSFGVSGIGVFDNFDSDSSVPVTFKTIDIKHTTIAEGSDGMIDTVYQTRLVTVRQLVQEYGITTVSEATRKLYNTQTFDQKVKVMHAVEPRQDIVMGLGNRQMPVASIHIEVDANHQLAESGYHEMPIFVTRFWKIIGETYGRSPAMGAMPDILELNSRREGSIIAVEKMLDPPLLVDPEQMLNNGEIDTSAGALNAMKISGRAAEHNRKPVEQMITVGELRSTDERIDTLQSIVEDYFFNDDMSDLNNEHRQTLGEAQIRNNLRGQKLVPVYKRQYNELFTRMIIRVFNICLLHGLLGFIRGGVKYMQNFQNGQPPLAIPVEVGQLMQSGKNVYDIEYVSPAMRIIRQDELIGIQQTASAVSGLAATVPTIMDTINWDELVKLTQELTGAPSQILQADDVIAKARQTRQQVSQQQAQAAQAEQMAHTAKAGAQAAEAAAKAGVPLAQLGMPVEGPP